MRHNKQFNCHKDNYLKWEILFLVQFSVLYCISRLTSPTSNLFNPEDMQGRSQINVLLLLIKTFPNWNPWGKFSQLSDCCIGTHNKSIKADGFDIIIKFLPFYLIKALFTCHHKGSTLQKSDRATSRQLSNGWKQQQLANDSFFSP